MQQKNRRMVVGWLPIGVRVAAAGDHPRQWKSAATLQAHGPTLGKSHQDGLLQGMRAVGKLEKTPTQECHRLRHSVPPGGEEVVPLTT